jgi:hypothetical protein
MARSLSGIGFSASRRADVPRLSSLAVPPVPECYAEFFPLSHIKWADEYGEVITAGLPARAQCKIGGLLETAGAFILTQYFLHALPMKGSP